MISKEYIIQNELILPCPKYYNLRTTCNAHGWIELAPFTWDSESCTLGTTVSTIDGTVDLTIEQQKTEIIINVHSHQDPTETHLNEIRSLVKRILDLDVDTGKFQMVGYEVGQNAS